MIALDTKIVSIRQANIARRHLTQEEKREAIRKRLAETPEKSDSSLAKQLGVSDKTVTNVRREMETGSEIPSLKTSKGTDGKTYPRQNERKPISILNPTPREEKAIHDCKPTSYANHKHHCYCHCYCCFTACY